MLEGSVPVQKHAFDLLFNMAVHANLFDDLSASGNPQSDNAVEEGFFFSLLLLLLLLFSLYDAFGLVSLGEKIKFTTEMIHEDLFQKLREMIYSIFHRRKMEGSLWKTALSCLFFFLSGNGNICSRRLNQVDIRWIPVFLSRAKGLSDFACRQLIKMLVNLLYIDGVLNKKRIEGTPSLPFFFPLIFTFSVDTQLVEHCSCWRDQVHHSALRVDSFC